MSRSSSNFTRPIRRRRSRPSQGGGARLYTMRDHALVRSALTRNPSIANELTRVTSGSFTTTSTIGNVIANIYSFNPSSTGYSDWTSLAGLYDEFRVVGGSIKFFCSQQNSITVSSANVVCVYDNDDATTALTSYNGALDYSNKIQFASVWDNNRFPTLTATCYSLASPGTGVGWSTTGSPGAYPRSFKLYSSGLSASTQYFDVTILLCLQFRGQT
jgi:hypothetical protein